MGIDILDNTELGEDTVERWFFHVKSEGNNKILAHSETYNSLEAAKEGVAALKKAVSNGKVKVFSGGKEVK